MVGTNPVRHQGGQASKGSGVGKRKESKKGDTVGGRLAKALADENDEEGEEGEDTMFTDKLEREQRRKEKLDKIKAEVVEELLGEGDLPASQQDPPAEETVSP